MSTENRPGGGSMAEHKDDPNTHGYWFGKDMAVCPRSGSFILFKRQSDIFHDRCRALLDNLDIVAGGHAAHGSRSNQDELLANRIPSSLNLSQESVHALESCRCRGSFLPSCAC